MSGLRAPENETQNYLCGRFFAVPKTTQMTVDSNSLYKQAELVMGWKQIPGWLAKVADQKSLGQTKKNRVQTRIYRHVINYVKV